MKKQQFITGLLFLSLLLLGCGKKEEAKMVTAEQQATIVKALIDKYGSNHEERISTGVRQVSELWRLEDGNFEALKQFCLENFIADEAQLAANFQRLQQSFETLSGTMVELERELKWNLDIDVGPILPVDYLLANFSLSNHIEDDLYKTKIAFFILLNYKVYTLPEVIEQGGNWSRQKWAEVRLADGFKSRVPSELNQKRYEAYVAADNYISSYNISMPNLLDEKGQRLWTGELKLISHWGLRDELKAQYAYADGLPRQDLIYQVMLRIIDQSIPAIVIDNPKVDWQVVTNQVSGERTDNSPEPNTRYYHLLQTFRSERACDPYYLVSKSKIERRFQDDREIPEETVKKLFTDLLKSPEFKATGELIAKRLGRPLRPFDIWYNGFKTQQKYNQDELDKIVRARFPNTTAFQDQLASILMRLGFDKQTAEFLKSKIDVDPARGSGHAMGAGWRKDNAHLRTRVPQGGMNYKGYNIAMHELGHCVEQVFSLNKIDYTLLQGVPNTAFTEAFAFIFQARDLDVLGLESNDPLKEHMDALQSIWATGEIAGVALVDMAVWHWMYDHPEATPAELKSAVIEIAKGVWNEYFAPVFGIKDTPILSIYSHMIDGGMYLPDYPIGHIIAFQIEQYIKGKNLAKEMERMCVQGNINPTYWMKGAVGQEISVQPMLAAVKTALEKVN
jgi:hypothetical protein